ncbi:glycosyltransferase [Pseudoalteromonas sp. SIMBA_153]|nr:glycosyltransferase [Pseudoalteromonas spiralis]
MGKRSIYVTTGTCHFEFSRMLNLVESCLKSVSEVFDVYLQYGNTNPIELTGNREKRDFYSRDQSESLYKNCDIVFSHCGIGSIFNSLKYNTPTVIIPRLKKFDEFSDDHQLQIAEEIKLNPLVLMLNEENPQLFLDFITKYQNHKKVEVDLINYNLASKLKSIILED